MNVKKKIIAMLSVFIMLSAVFSFAGCNQTKFYEAVIYNNDYSLVNENFLKKNMTYGAYYLNENSETVQDTTSPKTRTFVLSSIDDCHGIVDESIGIEADVDFDREVLILYLFTDTYHHGLPYWLTEVSVTNKVLNIGITLHQAPRAEDYTVPAYQRWIMVQMEKVAFNSVEFYEVTENTNPKNAFL